MRFNLLRLLPPLVCAMGLASCGGGGGSEGGKPSVTNIAADTVQFGRTMTIAVSGFELADGAIQLDVGGRCDDLTTASGGTETLQRFTCKPSDLGALRPRVLDAEGRELGSLSLNVPVPQVTVRVTQGTRTGTFIMELDPAVARSTVRNFLDYVNAAFYTNTVFHRVERDLVAQGGRTSSVNGATKPTLFPPIKLQADNGLKNLKYSLAMARTAELDSATSQFYINLKDNPEFDFGPENPGYAVFGKVISGTDVIDEIGKVELSPTTNPPSIPVPAVVVNFILQTR